MSTASVAQVRTPHKVRPFYQAPGHPIAYFPSLVPVAGSVKAAVLLCQLVYWTPRAKDATGWIYKSQLELMAETGLTRKEQRHAREELHARRLLEERYDRLDHQLWFRVNVEVYNAAILLISDQVPKGDLGTSPNGISGSPERAHGEVPKGDLAQDLSETPEITTETTAVPPLALLPHKAERHSPFWCEAHSVGHSERLPDHRPDCAVERRLGRTVPSC